jgi:uncharacterized protein YjbJ (UPF0337 family)
MSDNSESMTREAGGSVQDTVGKRVGDTGMQAPGIYNQVAGQAQEKVARLSEVIRDQPLTAALVAVGIGYVLGRLTA